jgi:hypothetical protein
MPKQEEGDEGHNLRKWGGGQCNKKRGTKDTRQGNRAMAVVGRGDMAGKKRNNQIEATMAVVGTVCTAMDSGEARAKGKMTRSQKMRGNQATEDAMRGVGINVRHSGSGGHNKKSRQHEVIGWWMT